VAGFTRNRWPDSFRNGWPDSTETPGRIRPKYAAALALGAGFVAVRKKSGHFPGELLTGDGVTDYKGDPVHLRLQRDRLDDGGRVLVVDDWLETGAQFAVARSLIEKTGARVVGASVLVDQTPQTLHPSIGKYRYLVALPPRIRPHRGR